MDVEILSLNECKRVLEAELKGLEKVESVVIGHSILWKGLLKRREQIHEDLRWIRTAIEHRKRETEGSPTPWQGAAEQ